MLTILRKFQLKHRTTTVYVLAVSMVARKERFNMATCYTWSMVWKKTHDTFRFSYRLNGTNVKRRNRSTKNVIRNIRGYQPTNEK